MEDVISEHPTEITCICKCVREDQIKIRRIEIKLKKLNKNHIKC